MALEDRFLSVQRRMIAVLAGQHVRQQPFSWPTPFDRTGRQVRDRHAFLAALADVLDPHVLADDEAGRNVVQLLGDLFAHPLFGPAALRTGQRLLRRMVFRPLARKMLGQRNPAVASGGFGRRFGLDGLLPDLLLQQIEQHLLIGIELLRAAAEQVPFVPEQFMLEGIDVGQQLQHHLTQHSRVLGQLVRRRASVQDVRSIELCRSIRNHKPRIPPMSRSVKHYLLEIERIIHRTAAGTPNRLRWRAPERSSPSRISVSRGTSISRHSDASAGR